MNHCPSCGSKVVEESKFCMVCGTNVEEKKYTQKDDPADELKKLRKKVDKIDEFLTEKYTKEEVKKDGGRKTLFGD